MTEHEKPPLDLGQLGEVALEVSAVLIRVIRTEQFASSKYLFLPASINIIRIIREHARVKRKHVSHRFPKSWTSDARARLGWGKCAFLVTLVTFTWARLFRSGCFHHVGITLQLKCVLSAVR